MTFKNFILITGLILFVVSTSEAQTQIQRSTVVEQYKGSPYYLHFVKDGETIHAILKVYDISKEELFSNNPFLQQGLQVDQVLRIPQKNSSDKPALTPDTGSKPAGSDPQLTYIVKKQETWYGISKQFNLSVEALIQANPEITMLKEGMELVLPAGTQMADIVKDQDGDETGKSSNELMDVRVEQGQTAYSISKQYGISVDEFYRLNPEAITGIKTDQIVKVPTLSPASNPPVNLSIPVEIPDAAGKERESVLELKPARHSPGVPDTCINLDNLSRTYDIALLLPLSLEEADSILVQNENSTKTPSDYKAYDFFQFYGGILIAADSLEKAGFRARIHVFDADKEGDTLKIKNVLRKSELSKMDLVIGPVFVKSFDIAAKYALKQKIRIINPLSRRERIINGNPYVYKVQSSDESIGTGLASCISKDFTDCNLILIRNDSKELTSMYNAFLDKIRNSESGKSLDYHEVNYGKESFQGVGKCIDNTKKNIVVFFTYNKALIPNFVSLLNNFGKNKDITLFGMPEWKDLDIETEFLVNLDYHEAVTSFVDYESEPVKQYIRQFRNAYGTEPLLEKQAFLGFDLGWYFFHALMNYGTDFESCLPYLNISGLQYQFLFMNPSKDDGYQNNSLRMLKLNNYQWVESK